MSPRIHFRNAVLLAGLAAGHSLAALSYPGCTDLVGSDFKEVVLVSRGTSPAPIVQDNTLFEPVSLFIGADGRVYWTELTNSNSVTATTPVPNNGTNATGRIRRFNPADSTLKTVASFAVATGSQSQVAGNAQEYGLRYFTLDPNYAVNKFAYVIYTPPTSVAGRGVDTMLLSRFYMPTVDSLDKTSEKKLLKMPWSPGICCHQGGAMDWDAQGNLYITTGNNTENIDEWAPMDTTRLGTAGENKDRAMRDNQARTANTLDWRGKVLRIHPDTSAKGYSIPAGNLRQRFFEVGGAWVAGQDTNKILPEIYTFGHRNPYSIAVDRVTGWVAIGEVGPDNGNVVARGPIGREEYSMIRKPGFYGWPYFVGENQGYAMYNPATASYNLPAQKPDSVTNTSPNNSGITRLPPATPPTLAHARAGAQPTTWFGSGATGGSAFTGPIYNYDNTLVSAKKLPPHLNRKWIIFENSKNWVKVATLNDSGVVTDLQDWPGYSTLFRGSNSVGLIDMKIGPDGAIYAAGYNAGFFQSTSTTRITKVEYKGSCGPTNVVGYRNPEQKRNDLMRGIFFAPQSGILSWPEGMTRVEAFDLQGKRVFSLVRGAGESQIATPKTLGASLLRVRFQP